MTFKFQEGDAVALKEDQADYLPAGSRGTIFCQYNTTPPAYEVNFWDIEGELLGAIMSEDEIEAVPAGQDRVNTPVREVARAA